MADHPTDPDCLFCKIVAGQIPCHKLREDAQVLAFLDIGPLSKGHTLVIPKAHASRLEQLPSDAAAACLRAAHRLAPAVLKAAGADAWNLLQNNGQVAGQVVGHVHFHIIPRSEGDGLGYRWPAGKLDDATAAQLVRDIAAAL